MTQSSDLSGLRALVFDAYGTIFDVASVFETCERHFPGSGKALSDMWRVKQLEYTWLRALMNKYEDFYALTEAGLRYSCRALGLELSNQALDELMENYFRLTPYAEVPNALTLMAQAHKLAILSNGSPEMLERVTENNGLTDRFDAIFSVHELRTFKPNPRVYQLAVDRLNVAPHEIGFVSSNSWDAAGAKAFGFYVFWINRFKRPQEELGHPPDQEVFTMDEIADQVAGG